MFKQSTKIDKCSQRFLWKNKEYGTLLVESESIEPKLLQIEKWDFWFWKSVWNFFLFISKK